MRPIQEEKDRLLALRLAVEEYSGATGVRPDVGPANLERLAVTAQADALAFFAGPGRTSSPTPTSPRPPCVAPRPPVESRPPVAPRSAPGFGGLVDLSRCTEAPSTRKRLKAIDDAFWIVKAKANGDCGYNAFLGTFAHTLSQLPPAAVRAAQARLESLPCDSLIGYAELAENRGPLALAVSDGYDALTTLVQFLAREPSFEKRTGRVRDFCHGPQFANAVAYLRARAAHEQLSDEGQRDYGAVCHYAWNTILEPSHHALVLELKDLAQSLGCSLAVMNPRESDRPLISPAPIDGTRPWGRLNLLCWAEGEPGSGHYDGLMPKFVPRAHLMRSRANL